MASGNRLSFLENRYARASTRLAILLAAAAACLPIWILPIPVSADLPQHLLQLKLLAGAAPVGPELQHAPWFYPNTLIYYLTYPIWLITTPIDAGRWILTLLKLSWILAIVFLARRFKRPIENALIATPLVFCFLFSWGFINFLVGWPIFCAFIWTSTQRQAPIPRFFGLLLLGTALYFAHALWFAAANVWLAFHMLIRREGVARNWVVAASQAPAWLAAAAWYPQLAMLRNESSVDTGMHWDHSLIDRADPSFVSDALFGTLYGPLELGATTLLFGWLGLCLFKPSNSLSKETNKALMLAGALLIGAYFVLPDRHMNTLYFNSRWMPFGMTLLLLASPAPRIPKLLTWGLPLALIFSLSMLTTREYRAWGTENLEGFFESISGIPPESHILTLNFSSASENVKGYPGLHLFVWAQLLQNAQVHFSFSEHHAAIVHSPPGFHNPARKLTWSPAAADKSLAARYDLILIHGDKTLHSAFQRKLDLEPVTTPPTRWRLYRHRTNPS